MAGSVGLVSHRNMEHYDRHAQEMLRSDCDLQFSGPVELPPKPEGQEALRNWVAPGFPVGIVGGGAAVRWEEFIGTVWQL